MIPQLCRLPAGDHRPGLSVEHDTTVGDGVDALQLVRHDDERDAEASRQLADQLIQPRGGDRIQARRGLVQEEDRRGPAPSRGRFPPASACRPRARTASSTPPGRGPPGSASPAPRGPVRGLRGPRTHRAEGARSRARSSTRTGRRSGTSRQTSGAGRSRFSPVAVTMSSPSNRICPAVGWKRPIIAFSNELLPQPEPPRMTKTSPRRTSKLTSLLDHLVAVGDRDAARRR